MTNIDLQKFEALAILLVTLPTIGLWLSFLYRCRTRGVQPFAAIDTRIASVPPRPILQIFLIYGCIIVLSFARTVFPKVIFGASMLMLFVLHHLEVFRKLRTAEAGDDLQSALQRAEFASYCVLYVLLFFFILGGHEPYYSTGDPFGVFFLSSLFLSVSLILHYYHLTPPELREASGNSESAGKNAHDAARKLRLITWLTFAFVGLTIGVAAYREIRKGGSSMQSGNAATP
jgi:hypothetical protein